MSQVVTGMHRMVSHTYSVTYRLILYMVLFIHPLRRSWKGRMLISRRPSIRLSVRLWTKSCPLCIFHNTRRIHIIFAHLSSNFKRCVACKDCCKFPNLNFCHFFYSQNAGVLVVLLSSLISYFLPNYFLPKITYVTLSFYVKSSLADHVQRCYMR